MEGRFTPLLRLRQGPARHSCRCHGEQTPRRRTGIHQGGTGQGRSEETPGRKATLPIPTDRPAQRRLEFTRRPEGQRNPQSQSGLRYLRSPPCQALLPSASGVTFLLCRAGDISTWLQQQQNIEIIRISPSTSSLWANLWRHRLCRCRLFHRARIGYGRCVARRSCSQSILKKK